MHKQKLKPLTNRCKLNLPARTGCENIYYYQDKRLHINYTKSIVDIAMKPFFFSSFFLVPEFMNFLRYLSKRALYKSV